MKYIDPEGGTFEVEGAIIVIPVKLTHTQAQYVHDAPEADSQWIREAVQARMDREQTVH